jgi:site-specific DNA-cytosine methylase
MGHTGNYPEDDKWPLVAKQRLPPGFFADVDLLVGGPPCQAFTVPPGPKCPWLCAQFVA